MLAIYLNTVLSAALFYTCFCRLVRTDETTLVLCAAPSSPWAAWPSAAWWRRSFGPTARNCRVLPYCWLSLSCKQ